MPTNSEKLKSFKPSLQFPQLCEGVTVDYCEKKGRFVKAIKNIPLGTVVCVERGITVNIDPSRCYKCLGELEDEKIVYCSNCTPCNEPNELSGGEFDDLGIFKLAAHIVLSYPFEQIMQLMCSPDPVEPLEAPTSLSTDNLDSILQLRPMPQIGDAFQTEHIQKAVKRMVKLLEKHADWGKLDDDMRLIMFSKALRLVAERSAKNSHVVYSIEQTSRSNSEQPLGTGLFPISSIFNHSCDPNVFAFFVQDHFIFVSRGVKAGEELVDSYGVTYLQNSFEQRTKFLSEVSGFACNCEKCEKQESLDEYLELRLDNLMDTTDFGDDVKTIEKYIESLSSGNKEIELLIPLIAGNEASAENPAKSVELWQLFVTNATRRGICHDTYLVRPYLEQLAVIFRHKLKNKEDYTSNCLFTVHQILHNFYGDLHPATGIVERILRSDTSAELELIKLVETFWH